MLASDTRRTGTQSPCLSQQTPLVAQANNIPTAANSGPGKFPGVLADLRQRFFLAKLEFAGISRDIESQYF